MENRRLLSLFLVFTVIPVLSINCSGNMDAEFEVVAIDRVGRDRIGDVIGNDERMPLLTIWTTCDFLVLTIRSRSDLAANIKNKNTSIYAEGSFCEAPNTSVLLNIPNLYFRGESLLDLAFVEDKELNPNPDGWFYYDIVIFISWEKEREIPDAFRKRNDLSNYAQFSFDTEAHDVCIDIRGGNTVDSYQFGNVRLSKSQIAAAVNGETL